MLTVLDAIRRIGQFEKELITAMPGISKEVSGLFLAAKISQIRRTGIGNYSKSVYSASLLKGKELNASGRSFLDSKIRRKEKTNWAGLRAAQGLQIGFVDVYYSGQMLNTTGIIRNNTVSYRFYCIIGGRNQESRDKLSANQKRYGNFLTPDLSQRLLMKNRSLVLIGNIYKRILLT